MSTAPHLTKCWLVSGSGRISAWQSLIACEESWKVASSTGGLDRAVVFGSFVTDEPEPNDVDVILVMKDDFEVTTGSAEVKALFDHERANRKYGASVFWIRRSLLISETLESFIAHWQVKRGGGRRGIVEIHHD